jgi:hypothetical protein
MREQSVCVRDSEQRMSMTIRIEVKSFLTKSFLGCLCSCSPIVEYTNQTEEV